MKRLTLRQMRNYWPVFLLVVPTFLLIGAFSYYPAYSAVYHSFFRWDGDDVLEPAEPVEIAGVKVGYLGNYQRALNDEELGSAFGLVMIFISANLVKMIPSIIIAVLIHRLASSRARYLYRVAFVMPMIIPAMVWLLIWKYFYNPTFGVLNRLLNWTGGMELLAWMDVQMPQLAETLAPLHSMLLRPVFGSSWGLGVMAALTLGLITGFRPQVRLVLDEGEHVRNGINAVLSGIVRSISAIGRGWMWWALLFAFGVLTMGALRLVLFFAALVTAVQMARLSNLADPAAKRNGAFLVLGICFALAAAAALLTESLPAAAFVMFLPLLFLLSWLTWDVRTFVRHVGAVGIALFAVIVLASMTWKTQIGAFEHSKPGWLSTPKLIPAALIFWGFPWVGIVSVLLYLSGLGNIDQSVYEASEIDGCGWFRKFWNVELPLIMTQVRLNLVLMVIATLKGWGQVFILLGDSGGPKGAGMLPGLYMFRQAFTDGQAGYGCAIGLLLFLLILFLTLINNKYVRVEK